ncbi:hypothetical protein BRAS3843_3160032 [Bradyrhizobium sp. STM 3843]|nr:hypothetical protein BRAS3843_3160032 [Bradyrhizobium sp. STM 3843]
MIGQTCGDCRLLFSAGGPWVRSSPGLPCALAFTGANQSSSLGCHAARENARGYPLFDLRSCADINSQVQHPATDAAARAPLRDFPPHMQAVLIVLRDISGLFRNLDRAAFAGGEIALVAAILVHVARRAVGGQPVAVLSCGFLVHAEVSGAT